MKLKVYKNNRRQCFSVVNPLGKVERYATELLLKNCSFHVQPKGREKVLKTKQKNVHAYIKGEKNETIPKKVKMKRCFYNPYITDKFVDIETGQEIDTAKFVNFNFPYVWYSAGKQKDI